MARWLCQVPLNSLCRLQEEGTMSSTRRKAHRAGASPEGFGFSGLRNSDFSKARAQVSRSFRLRRPPGEAGVFIRLVPGEGRKEMSRSGHLASVCSAPIYR